jgi:hypothetical protein
MGRLGPTDSLDELSGDMTSFDVFNEFVGLSVWRDLEDRYAAKPATGASG